jgi:hypothetical protein
MRPRREIACSNQNAGQDDLDVPHVKGQGDKPYKGRGLEVRLTNLAVYLKEKTATWWM